MERIDILKVGFLSHYQRRLDAHITRNSASRFLKPTLDCMQIPKTHPGDCSSFFEKFSKKLVSYFSPSPFLPLLDKSGCLLHSINMSKHSSGIYGAFLNKSHFLNKWY